MCLASLLACCRLVCPKWVRPNAYTIICCAHCGRAINHVCNPWAHTNILNWLRYLRWFNSLNICLRSLRWRTGNIVMECGWSHRQSTFSNPWGKLTKCPNSWPLPASVLRITAKYCRGNHSLFYWGKCTK